jgi:RNA polymerase sigma factor (sigma-70 family)
MTNGQLGTVLRQIRQISDAQAHVDLSDGQLLRRFVTFRDEVAFAALVERHGGLVLGVCRRVLLHEQDAEDAFQATFLILARKAAAIRKLESVASWLHGVAQRTAMNARKSAMRRRQREQPAAQSVPESPVNMAALKELQTLLDEEVQRLPERYRAPFVLCCLEGKSRPEAAAHLGWKEGTVSSRLSRARQRLQQQLTRRGVALSAAMCTLALADKVTSAAVPAGLADRATKAALQFTAGNLTAGAISEQTAALAEGVLRAMFVSKLKKIGVLVLLAMTLALAALSGAIHYWEAAAWASKNPAGNLPQTPPVAAGKEKIGVVQDKKDEAAGELGQQLLVSKREKVDKDQPPAARKIDIKGVPFDRPEVRAGPPTTITNPEELAKIFPEKDWQAKITGQGLDFAKEQLLFFAWAGSGADKLAVRVDQNMQGPVVVFSYSTGKTKTLASHLHLYAVAKGVRWRFEILQGFRSTWTWTDWKMHYDPKKNVYTAEVDGSMNLLVQDILPGLEKRTAIFLIKGLVDNPAVRLQLKTPKGDYSLWHTDYNKELFYIERQDGVTTVEFLEKGKQLLVKGSSIVYMRDQR